MTKAISAHPQPDAADIKNLPLKKNESHLMKSQNVSALHWHPVNNIDFYEIARVFTSTINQQSEHWDKDMLRMHPEMCLDTSQEAEEILSNCVDRGLIDDYIEFDDPQAATLIDLWSRMRAPECREKMQNIPIKNGHITAHRMIACRPEDLKNPLGIYWSHDFPNWPDPVTPWGANLHGTPTLIVEAKIPVKAVNWEYSALCLMSWLLGDTESELRVYPGYKVQDVHVTILGNGKEVKIPEQEWQT